MQNTKSTYLIIKLEIKKEADIDDIICEIREREFEETLTIHKDITKVEIIGSSDGLIFD